MTEENKQVLLDYFSGKRIFKPTEKDDWEEAIKERDEKITEYYSNWKRHIVDNGYNADWKCKKCGYVVKTDYPPMECPKCMRGDKE